MLSEETTRLIAIKDEAQGFSENHEAARRGGELVGDTRRNYEKKEGLKVVSTDNFLNLVSGEKTTPELLEGEKID